MKLTPEYYEYENKFYRIIRKIGYLSEFNLEKGWIHKEYLQLYQKVLMYGTNLDTDEALDKLQKLMMIRELVK